MKKYDYIIWDFNGTLINDVDLCFNILNTMLLNRNIKTVTMEQYKEIFRFPVIEYYKLAGFTFEKESFAEAAVDFIDRYQLASLECGLYKDAIKVIEHIKSLGIKQLILSASEISNLKMQTKHYNLDGYMDAVLGIDNIHAGSKIEIGKAWISENNVDPSKVLFIGDTDHDFEVASAMGVNSLLIANGHQSKERLLKVNNEVVNEINDVINYLDK